MTKVFAMLMAAVMVAALFAGCGAGSADANTIKIGMTGPLTGDAAIYGTAVKNGIEIAVAEINEKAKAEGGLKIEFKAEDDEADGEKAVSGYNVLKDWGMQVFIGTVTSGACNAVAPGAVADQMFLLTPSASSAEVAMAGGSTFQMCFTDPNQGASAAEVISLNWADATVGVIYDSSDDYSSGLYEGFKAKAGELGLNVVCETSFTKDTKSDLSTQVTQCKDAGADLVFLPMYYQPASLIFAQAKAMGYAPTWFGVDGMDGILTMEGFDTSLAERVMLLTPFNADSTDERTQNFVAEYQKRFGEVPNQFAADAYDCVYAYKQALENAGATADMSAEDLCAAMIEQFTSMTFDGLTGEGMTWDASGAVSKSPKGMVIENGAYVGLD